MPDIELKASSRTIQQSFRNFIVIDLPKKIYRNDDFERTKNQSNLGVYADIYGLQL